MCTCKQICHCKCDSGESLEFSEGKIYTLRSGSRVKLVVKNYSEKYMLVIRLDNNSISEGTSFAILKNGRLHFGDDLSSNDIISEYKEPEYRYFNLYDEYIKQGYFVQSFISNGFYFKSIELANHFDCQRALKYPGSKRIGIFRINMVTLEVTKVSQ